MNSGKLGQNNHCKMMCSGVPDAFEYLSANWNLSFQPKNSIFSAKMGIFVRLVWNFEHLSYNYFKFSPSLIEISELLAENLSDFGTYTRVSRACQPKTKNLTTRKKSFFSPMVTQNLNFTETTTAAQKTTQLSTKIEKLRLHHEN